MSPVDQVLKVGIDIGSTTIKAVVLNDDNEIIYKQYERHFSDIKTKLNQILTDTYKVLRDSRFNIMITGSGGMNIAKHMGIPFTQEVIASTKAISTFYPQTDVAIELGGEDAKITY